MQAFHCTASAAKLCFRPVVELKMVGEVALRPERLEVEAVQGRGKGRIKARASALALGTGHCGLQLAHASKCAAS